MSNVGADEIVASSSSAITHSTIARGLPRAHQVIVANPGNPPLLVSVIEIVSSEATTHEITEKSIRLYRDAGGSTVLVNKEVKGFVFIRLQEAVLRGA